MAEQQNVIPVNTCANSQAAAAQKQALSLRTSLTLQPARGLDVDVGHDNLARECNDVRSVQLLARPRAKRRKSVARAEPPWCATYS